MSVFQDLYDSETNFHISTMWDGGFEVKLGDEMNGFFAEACFERFGMVEYWIISKMLELRPDSTFSHHYRQEVEYAKSGIHPRCLYAYVGTFMRIRATGDVGLITESKIEGGALLHKVGLDWIEDSGLKCMTHDETKALRVVVKKADAPEDPGINR